jgi:hypothetical protein
MLSSPEMKNPSSQSNPAWKPKTPINGVMKEDNLFVGRDHGHIIGQANQDTVAERAGLQEIRPGNVR